MKWSITLMILLLMVSSVLLRPLPIYIGYQVVQKVEACKTALNVVEREGYKILLKSSLASLSESRAELTEECSSSSVSYCLIVPGTNPLVFLRVEEG